MQTWLTQRFGVRVPVVCAPMAGVASGRLATAVSAAGALGMVGVGARHSPEWVTRQAAEAATGVFGFGLQAWVLESRPQQMDAALEAGPALVSVSYGNYARWVERVHAAGLPLATTVATADEARAALAAGVDVLVARGREGGGHGRDAMGTLPLLQDVLDVAGDVPVLAAGAIAGARGLAAVLAAGAAGAWAGTAFLTCEESDTPAAARVRLGQASGADTVYTRVFDVAARSGWPAEFGERALRNGFHDEWVGREDELAINDGVAERYRRASAALDYDVACLDAGQGVGLLKAEASAVSVVAEFARWETLQEGSVRRRDRTPEGRPQQSRPRDALGRPLPYGHPDGVEPVSEEPLPPPEALAFAQTLLGQGRAFSAHEVLEAAWKAAPAQERDLWKGLAQLCVAITHAHRGNQAGATTLLQRAQQHLGGYAGSRPHAVDVDGLLAWCGRIREPRDLTASLPRLQGERPSEEAPGGPARYPEVGG
ncbi:hypothetical protein Kisp01_23380 [Kineosporia sp. NBRC 101677]|uniref:DUF309 domain-containing protein n=1 Tax=Kineosporia sp. NBRC 101677 TaxID=3032197 RepID=UPI0024A4867F|nr:DUF309 domain-containing protein [Kineosporia sp. NBRC 101677]GLY15323.1 hypothetical protein Kisp01_23380 [Kineosporia sp. NBRC 101677]